MASLIQRPFLLQQQLLIRSVIAKQRATTFVRSVQSTTTTTTTTTAAANNNNGIRHCASSSSSASVDEETMTQQTITDTKVEYVSPFRELFDTINQGKTFLGTKQFNIPKLKYLNCGIPEHALKFKTTTYGRLLEEPFVSSQEHRVTVQVGMESIPLTSEMERIVFYEIVGTRFNPETGILQLSSNQFGSRIENKRHVVSMLERIVESTKTLAAKVQAEIKEDDDNNKDDNEEEASSETSTTTTAR